MPITADTARKGLLLPALDARAHNLDQEALIFNPSPERDSLLEWANELSKIAPDIAAELLVLMRRLLESNMAEGECERAFAGIADKLAARLHDRERNGNGQVKLKTRAIANRLRLALNVIQTPGADPMAYVRACRDIDEIRASVPVESLLCDQMLRELRSKKYELLRTLVESPDDPDGAAA